MPDAIVTEHLRKTFGKKVAVDDVSIRIPEGGLYGFIGPNGAGKTTTIRMIMSIIFPDQGELSVLGHKSALDAKDKIGYLPEERGVYKKMKVGAFIEHMAKLKGVSPRGLDRKIKDWLDRVELADTYKKKCEELSKGMQQKVQFIASIIHEPELLIFDEPFSGLDPVNMRLLRSLMQEQHDMGRTIIFSTHVMHQAEQLCDHIIMIHQGRKVLDETLEGIRRRYDPRTIVFDPLDRDADLSRLDSVPGVRAVAHIEGMHEISLDEGANPGDVMRDLAAAVPPSRVELRRPTLEDVFIDIAKPTGNGQTDESSMRAALRETATVSEES